MVALRQLLGELGEHEAIADGTVIATDNEAAITCSIQPTSLKNRHFCLSTEFVRDHAENNSIHVHYVPGTENPADLYTKSSLEVGTFVRLSAVVMGEKPFFRPVPFIR